MWLKRWPVSFALLVLMGAGSALLAKAADHSDAPVQGPQVRQDVNITDVHAFVVGPPHQSQSGPVTCNKPCYSTNGRQLCVPYGCHV